MVNARDRDKLLGLPHIGALCGRIRESRNVTVAQMAEWCGLDARKQHTRISRNFEQEGQLGQEIFDRYVEALRSEERVSRPISDTQARMHDDLYRERSKKRIAARECELAAVGLDDVYVDPRPEGLVELTARLRNFGKPAYIVDDLWFIHVINGDLLALFGVQPDADYLYRWDAWHSVAIKIAVESNVRRSYAHVDEFVPAVLAWFFESASTYPYLFTFQMQALLNRLLRLSRQENHTVHKWWEQTVAFDLPFEFTTMTRSLDLEDQDIRIDCRCSARQAVDVNVDTSVGYTICYFTPRGAEAENYFDQIAENPFSGQLFYAVDYDRGGNFHVNTWPEVAERVESWLDEGRC